MEAMVPRREMPVPLLLRGRRQPLRVLLTPGFPARKQVSAAAFPAPSRHTLASVRVFRSEPLEETADRARILTTANSSGRIQVTALVPRFLQFSIACFVSVATHPVPSDSDVSEAFVKIVEDFMKGVSDYGASESEQPPTIYKVPEEMKNSHKEAYNPIIVWISLFNGDNETRRHGVIRGYKWCCMRKLISRHHLLQEPERTPVLLRRCLEALEGVLPRIISSYVPCHHQVRYDHGLRQSILSIMLRDGCFILHRLIKYARIARREPANPTGSGASDNMVWGFVTCNLLLLENQIPFFVVQKLFQQLRTDPDESSDVLVASALRLFRSLRPWKLHSSAITGCDVHHLLHLFYLSVGLPEEAVPATHDDARRHAAPLSELPQWIPSARELEEAGVKFRARKDAKSFLDVRFHGGVLEIPELELYDYSEPLFRNLIAFEQTYPFTPGHVTAYAIFMDCLVTSPEDMRLLHLSGVLVNQMNGERDAAGFFGRLCAEAHLASDHNYLAGVILEINRYQRSRWPRLSCGTTSATCGWSCPSSPPSSCSHSP
ncbi:hypothetical protein ACQ4PT_057269 [Festuca glaucescens]